MREPNGNQCRERFDPLRIIADYYRPGSAAYDMLVRHGEQVAAKALAVAAHLASDRDR